MLLFIYVLFFFYPERVGEDVGVSVNCDLWTKLLVLDINEPLSLVIGYIHDSDGLLFVTTKNKIIKK